MKQYILFILSLLCVASCTEYGQMGEWDDNIFLSTRSVALNGTGDTVTVNTKGKNWWISTIEVDGEVMYYPNDSTENWNMYQTGKFNQKCDWLNVRVDDWTLYISADDNFRKERTFKITLESGDYFDHISGTQKIKNQ